MRSALSTEQAIASQLTPYSTVLQKTTVVQLLRKKYPKAQCRKYKNSLVLSQFNPVHNRAS